MKKAVKRRKSKSASKRAAGKSKTAKSKTAKSKTKKITKAKAARKSKKSVAPRHDRNSRCGEEAATAAVVAGGLAALDAALGALN